MFQQESGKLLEDTARHTSFLLVFALPGILQPQPRPAQLSNAGACWRALYQANYVSVSEECGPHILHFIDSETRLPETVQNPGLQLPRLQEGGEGTTKALSCLGS